MGRSKDPRQMNGGYQLTMFDNEPEPAIQAGPAPAGDVEQPSVGDSPATATTVANLHGHQEAGRE